MSIHSTALSEWEGALVVKPRVAWKMLSCSNTRGYELLAAGELDSFRDGRSRKITVESIRRYIARRLPADAASTGAEPKRGRGRPRKVAAQPEAGGEPWPT
jgi:hypothetical protein